MQRGHTETKDFWVGESVGAQGQERGTKIATSN